jgi:chromate reductase
MAATSGLKTAIDRVSRMKDQPFKDKPVALRSAAAGILGGSRAQYHLRQCLTSIDAILLGRPEARSAAAHAERGRGRRVRRPYEGSFFAIVTFAPKKFDEKTPELEDPTAIDLIKQQLAGCEKSARRVGGKG